MELKVLRIFDDKKQFEKKATELLEEGFEIQKETFQVEQHKHLTGVFFTCMFIKKESIYNSVIDNN